QVLASKRPAAARALSAPMQIRVKVREEVFFMIERRLNKICAIWVAAIDPSSGIGILPMPLLCDFAESAIADCRSFATHLRYRSLKIRPYFPALLICLFLAQVCGAQDQRSTFTSADTEEFNFRQFGLMAIQDGGRRKP